MENSEEYFNALIDAKKFHDNPVGFSAEHTGSIQDQIIIKQNNIILILLIRILDKLDSIKTHISDKTPVNTELKEELDAIVQNLKTIKIDKPKPPTAYTFFAAKPSENKENKVETSTQNGKSSDTSTKK